MGTLFQAKRSSALCVAMNACIPTLSVPLQIPRTNNTAPPRAARPALTCYLMPLAFTAVARRTSHSHGCSCQRLSALTAAKPLVHSCGQSLIQPNVEPFPLAEQWPGCPGATHHFAARTASLLLSLPEGVRSPSRLHHLQTAWWPISWLRELRVLWM